MFPELWGGVAGVLVFFVCRAVLAAPVTLKNVHVIPRHGFTRVVFSFDKGLPGPVAISRKGASLIFLFKGVANRHSAGNIWKGAGLVRKVRAKSFGKNLRLNLLLKTSRFDFIKHSRRHPPEVILSLRVKKSVVPLRAARRKAHTTKKVKPTLAREDEARKRGIKKAKRHMKRPAPVRANRDLKAVDRPKSVKCAVACPGFPEAEEALFIKGKQALSKQAFPEAEEVFLEYLDKYPSGRFAMHATCLLGDALYYRGEVVKAIDAYERVLARWPDAFSCDFKTLENRVRVFEKQRAYDKALSLLFSVLNIASTGQDTPRIMLRIAEVYQRQNRYKEVLKIYSAIAVGYPKTPLAFESRLRMAELGVSCPGIRYKGFLHDPDPYKHPLKGYEFLLARHVPPAVVRGALLGKARLISNKTPGKAIKLLGILIRSYPASKEASAAKTLQNKICLTLLTRHGKGDKIKKCGEIFKWCEKSGLKPEGRVLLKAAWCCLKEKDIMQAEKIFGDIRRTELPESLRESYAFLEVKIAFQKGDFTGASEKIFAFLKAFPKSRNRDEMTRMLQRAIADLGDRESVSAGKDRTRELLEEGGPKAGGTASP